MIVNVYFSYILLLFYIILLSCKDNNKYNNIMCGNIFSRSRDDNNRNRIHDEKSYLSEKRRMKSIIHNINDISYISKTSPNTTLPTIEEHIELTKQEYNERMKQLTIEIAEVDKNIQYISIYILNGYYEYNTMLQQLNHTKLQLQIQWSKLQKAKIMSRSSQDKTNPLNIILNNWIHVDETLVL